MGHGAVATEILIIGAGIVGCSVAHELSGRGREVLVLDKDFGAGSGSTSSSSSIIRFNYSTAEGVMAAWESKFYWENWADFVSVGARDSLARYHKVGVLLLDAVGDYQATGAGYLDRVGVPYEYLGSGNLPQRFAGLDFRRFGPPRALADERFWDDGHGLLSGYFTPDGGFVDDPQLAARNLATAARLQGAEFRFGHEVVEINRRAGVATGATLRDGTTITAKAVVNAAGPASGAINRLAGVLPEFATLATRPLRQEVHSLSETAQFSLDLLSPVVLDPDLGIYFRPHLGAKIVVGGLEPECDPLIWIDDPESVDRNPSSEAWMAQTYRLGRRIPALRIPNRPVGLADLYDVTPDWLPIFDKTSLDGYFVAIGTSGNQFKNAPVIGLFLNALIEAWEAGRDHDKDPVSVRLERSGNILDLAHYSRLRLPAATRNNVLG